MAPASLLQLLTKKKNKDGAAAAASSAGASGAPTAPLLPSRPNRLATSKTAVFLRHIFHNNGRASGADAAAAPPNPHLLALYHMPSQKITPPVRTAAPAEPASGGRVQALLPAHALRGRGRAPIFALCGIV